MALPTSRNTTYAPSSMLKSLDLNDIQDWIINVYAGRPLHIPASTGRAFAGTWTDSAYFGKTTTGLNDQQLFAPLVLEVGAIVTSLAVRAAWEPDTSGATAVARLARITDGTVEFVTGASATIPDNAGAFSTETGAFSAVIENGWDYYVTAEVDGGAGGSPSFTVQWWELTIGFPQ